MLFFESLLDSISVRDCFELKVPAECSIDSGYNALKLKVELQ